MILRGWASLASYATGSIVTVNRLVPLGFYVKRLSKSVVDISDNLAVVNLPCYLSKYAAARWDVSVARLTRGQHVQREYHTCNLAVTVLGAVAD